MAFSMLQFLDCNPESRFTVCNESLSGQYNVTPTETDPNLDFMMSFWESTGLFEDYGMKTVKKYKHRGRTLGELADDAGLSARAKKRLFEDWDPDAQYGSGSIEKKNIMDKLFYVKKWDESDKDPYISKGDRRKKLAESYDNLEIDLESYGEAEHGMVTERMEGVFGTTTIDTWDAGMRYMKKNPDVDFSSASITDDVIRDIYADMSGGDVSQLNDEEIKHLRDRLEDKEFGRYVKTQEIADITLSNQLSAAQRWEAAQEKVNAPGYAKNMTNEAFAPAREKISEFFKQGGDFWQGMGEGQAARGMVGNEKMISQGKKLEAEQLKGIDIQQAMAQSNLQQSIDMNEPYKAMSLTGQLGPQAFGYANQAANQGMGLVSQYFSQAMSGNSANLASNRYGPGGSPEPNWFDYATAGIEGLSSIFRGFV